MSQSLTLYDLSQELVQLMDAWDDPETSQETRAQIEVQLRTYADAHVQKVDDIRNYMRHLAVMEAALREEAATQKASAEACKARLEWLKAYCCEVMVQHGAKRWDGRTGSLLCKGNGGKQPVTITDESMVPDEFCMWDGSISGAAWSALEKLVTDSYPGMSPLSPESAREDWEHWCGRQDVQLSRTPRKSLIEAELQKPCETCGGSGGSTAPPHCFACGGSGRRGVPGCRLEPRGSHLEVK